MNRYLSLRLVFGLGLVVLFASACGAFASAPTPTPIPPTATTAPTVTPVPPTATTAPTVTPVPTASPIPVGLVYFFFSTDCEYCIEQAHIMEQFHQDNPNIRVVGVPLHGSQVGANNFASLYKLTFEVQADRDLVKALGAVIRHPAIAFQSVSGGPLIRASDGIISEKMLTESFQTFATGGSITTRSGRG